ATVLKLTSDIERQQGNGARQIDSRLFYGVLKVRSKELLPDSDEPGVSRHRFFVSWTAGRDKARQEDGGNWAENGHFGIGISGHTKSSIISSKELQKSLVFPFRKLAFLEFCACRPLAEPLAFSSVCLGGRRKTP